MSTVGEALDRGRVTTAEGLELFDSLDTVTPDFMIGTWAGSELASGHRLDGLLEAAGWYGKQFVDSETVHPLLFHTADRQAAFPVNPALVPLVPLPGTRGTHRMPYHSAIVALRSLISARRGDGTTAHDRVPRSAQRNDDL